MRLMPRMDSWPLALGDGPLIETRRITTGTKLVVWVGDRPGYKEKQTGIAGSGRGSEILLEGYLKEIPDAEHWITNLLRRFLAETPNAGEYKRQAGFLLDDLAQLGERTEERALVCMGGAAAKYVMQFGGYKDMNLRKCLSMQSIVVPLAGHDWTVFFTYNPAYLLPDGRPELAPNALMHLGVVNMWMRNLLPTVTRPNIIPPRAPIVKEQS